MFPRFSENSQFTGVCAIDGTNEKKIVNCRTIQSFRLFAQACLGVVFGVLLAVAIAQMIWPPGGPPETMPVDLLPWLLSNVYQKTREKGFYLLALVLGAACSYFATYRIFPGKMALLLSCAALILSIPISNAIIKDTLTGSSANIPILVALVCGGMFAVLTLRHGRSLTKIVPSPNEISENDPKLWPYFILLVLLTLILIPSSFEAVAAKIGLNFHPVAFLFGPALYSLGERLLPGIDYYAQYSIGLPWLFHFVMGHSAERAVLNYTGVAIVATWLFYAQLLFLLQWLYRSWIAAAVVAFIPLILGFGFPDAHQAFFFAPSSSVLRYPLLIISALVAGFWAEDPARPARLLLAAAVTAGSIFLETESGIVTLAATALIIFILHPWRRSIIIPISAFIAVTLVFFLTIVSAVFGPGALQVEFYRRLFEGIFLSGISVVGSVPVNWTMSEWNWLYHFVAPGASLATIAVIARACGNFEVDKKRAAVLAFFAASGLMLHFKFANMSLIGVWQMSAVGPFCVLGWWCVTLLHHIDPNLMRREGSYTGFIRYRSGKLTFHHVAKLPFHLRGAIAASMIMLALIFLFSPSERRNPGRYGLRAWIQYPSLLKWPIALPQGCIQMNCVPNRPAASDVNLIQSRTQPGEQVAIVVDLYDWTYLLAAHRPPLMFWLPSVIIFNKQHFDVSLERLRNANYIFIPKEWPHGTPYDEFNNAIEPILNTEFQKDGEGDRLVAWKHVIPSPID